MSFYFTARTGRPRALTALEHYFLAPVFLALWSGITRAGTHEFPDPVDHIYYWLMSGVPAWWCYTAATWGLAVLFRPWRPPLWSILLLGFGVGYFALWAQLIPLRNMISEIWLGYNPGPFIIGAEGWSLTNLVAYMAFCSVPWLAFNLWHYFILGVPKFGYQRHAAKLSAAHRKISALRETADEGQAETSLPPPQHLASGPALARRVGVVDGASIVALTAQEHYTLVQTTAGAKLVLMRLSDAIAEMAPVDGLRVHRSHWVARDYIAGVERTHRNREVVLRNGQRVPISRSYALAVNEALAVATAPKA